MKKPSHQVHLLTSGESIPYTIVKGSSNRKHVTLQITYNGELVVIIPQTASKKNALEAITQKTLWINSQINKLRNRPKPVLLTYTNGEAHLYHGKWYPIILLPSAKKIIPFNERVILTDTEIHIKTHSTNPLYIQKTLQKWYKNKTQQTITKHLETILPKISWLQKTPTWNIRKMKHRWGSCSVDGAITVNTHLVKAPPICLKYVLLHEIAHLKEHNHSPNYYKVLKQLMPEWEEVSTLLETLAPVILSE